MRKPASEQLRRLWTPPSSMILHPLDNQVLQQLYRELGNYFKIDYTDEQGLRSVRHIRSLKLALGPTTRNPKIHWVVHAEDVATRTEQVFDLDFIHRIVMSKKIHHAPVKTPPQPAIRLATALPHARAIH